MDLALTLQRLYDSEINVTITWLWDGGFQFSLRSYMELEFGGYGTPLDYGEVIISTIDREPRTDPDPWHSVSRAEELAPSIHAAAVASYPNSGYAKLYGKVN